MTADAPRSCLPTELTVRRADTTEAIGNALVAKANGAGHRTIAAGLDRPASTVRRWLRGARGAHAQWLYQQGVQKVVAVDRDLLTRLAPQRTPLGWAMWGFSLFVVSQVFRTAKS